MIVYIAGPLGKPEAWEVNIARAVAAGNAVADAGHSPIVPHLFVSLDRERPRTHAEWMKIDLAIVRKCDAVLRIPGDSPGADEEVRVAIAAKIPVVYEIADLDFPQCNVNAVRRDALLDAAEIADRFAETREQAVHPRRAFSASDIAGSLRILAAGTLEGE